MDYIPFPPEHMSSPFLKEMHAHSTCLAGQCSICLFTKHLLFSSSIAALCIKESPYFSRVIDIETVDIEYGPQCAALIGFPLST
jgi:hypothetical protein